MLVRNLLPLSLISVASFAFSSPVSAQRSPNVARSLSAAVGAQSRMLWIDGTANLFRKVTRNGVSVYEPYTTTDKGVEEIVARCKKAHINTLVVDVKPLSGNALYKSSIAPRLTEWQGKKVPDFDILEAFVREGKKAGLSVYAAGNTLSEGHKYYSLGPAYDHPEWQSVVYGVDRGLISKSGARMSIRVANEPDDAAKPLLLADSGTVLSAEPTARIGLDSSESGASNISAERSPLDQKLHVLLNAENRVEGFVDNGLLGDDPLIASENGRLITVTRDTDRDFVRTRLRSADRIVFDVKDVRTAIAKAPSEKIACFVSLCRPDVRKYELSVIDEVVRKYDVDGYVLDRCRYSNIYNDFSDATRADFEAWLGKKINRFPQDIFAFAKEPGEPIIRGPLYKKWLEYRATTIRNFVGDIARTVRTAKPGAKLGTYVGSWFPSYYEVGVNWSSPDTHLRYGWETAEYPDTGYAQYFDWITTGCYHPVPTKREARRAGKSERGSVEYLAEMSQTAIANAAFVYPGIYAPDYANKPQSMIRALEAAASQGQGWMIFDLSSIESNNLWPALESGFTSDVPTPESVPGLLEQVRSASSVTR